MMEHIRQFDWCSSTVDRHFVEESDLDNCVTEKILRNKFYDPLISSDSENEAPNVIDWVDICKKRDNFQSAKMSRVYIAGLRAPPPFPKLSALTAQQHLQCLKVLCADNPQILEAEFLPRPTKQDHKVFEEVKEIYAAEQAEFKEWAGRVWSGGQCVRVVRPRPAVEAAAGAEHALRLHRARALPAAYTMAAQIPLTTRLDCDLTHLQDLINVNVSELPEIQLPESITKRFNIIRPRTAPTPCVKHPCRFILPNESSMSVLPLPELQRELAQYARDNGAVAIASEGALKCLLELDRVWLLPLAVCDVMDPEGEKCNVVVLGSEFSINKESASMRTYRAFRHLLDEAVIPVSERLKVLNRSKNTDKSSTNNNNTMVTAMSADDTDSDDDGDNLYIDTDYDQNNGMETETNDTEINENDENKENGETENGSNEEMGNDGDKTDKPADDATNGFNEIGCYRCTCKDNFVKPPPRSFKKWQVRAKNSGEKYDIIVHCAHKTRGAAGEVYMEPLPEYQAELAASLQSSHKLASLELSLLLRRNATLINVRVDATSGDVVRHDTLSLEQLQQEQQQQQQQQCSGDVTGGSTAGTLHAALDQLTGLLPGHYILQHEPAHGCNALLFATRGRGGGAELRLDAPRAAPDEHAAAAPPPALAPILLPVHKHRKVLPCAFSPHGAALAPAARAPRAARLRPPPPAIKWPKRKPKKKKTAH